MFHKEPQMAPLLGGEASGFIMPVSRKRLILQGADMLRPEGMLLLLPPVLFSKKENEEVIALSFKRAARTWRS